MFQTRKGGKRVCLLTFACHRSGVTHTGGVGVPLQDLYRPNQWRHLIPPPSPTSLGLGVVAALIVYVRFAVSGETFTSRRAENCRPGCSPSPNRRRPLQIACQSCSVQLEFLPPRNYREKLKVIAICVFLASPAFHHPNNLYSTTEVELLICCLVLFFRRVSTEFKGAWSHVTY